jgi:hypothetical protein
MQGIHTETAIFDVACMHARARTSAACSGCCCVAAPPSPTCRNGEPTQNPPNKSDRVVRPSAHSLLAAVAAGPSPGPWPLSRPFAPILHVHNHPLNPAHRLLSLLVMGSSSNDTAIQCREETSFCHPPPPHRPKGSAELICAAVGARATAEQCHSGVQALSAANGALFRGQNELEWARLPR